MLNYIMLYIMSLSSNDIGLLVSEKIWEKLPIPDSIVSDEYDDTRQVVGVCW